MTTAVDRVVPLRAFAGLAGACACGAVAVAMGLHGVAAAAAGLCAVASLLLGLRVRAQGADRAASVSSQLGRQALELERLRHAIELAAVGTWQWDLKNARIDYSPELRDDARLRRGRDRPTLSAWGKLVHPEDLAAVRARVDAMIDGQVDEYEARVRPARRRRQLAHHDRSRSHHRTERLGQALRAVGVHVDASPRAPVKAAAVVTRGRWLVVDDDESVRTVIETAARRAGLAVVGFADGRAAWQAICGSGCAGGHRHRPRDAGHERRAARRARPRGRPRVPGAVGLGRAAGPGPAARDRWHTREALHAVATRSWLAQHARAAASGRRRSPLERLTRPAAAAARHPPAHPGAATAAWR
ncbi:MAG: hypothetical protein U0168_00325 [Nannocystaceae bacterium]